MSLADKAGLKQEDLLDVLGLGAMANPMFGEQQHAAQLQLMLHVRVLVATVTAALHLLQEWAGVAAAAVAVACFSVVSSDMSVLCCVLCCAVQP